MTRLVCMSDTHEQIDQLHGIIPDGDIFVHAGDLTMGGDEDSVRHELESIAALPHRFKAIVAGNHDWLFERDNRRACKLIPSGIVYLQEQGIVTLAGLRFWGSPITPRFGQWAFNRSRGPDIRRHWDLIPSDTDVLVTHGPAYGRGDLTNRGVHAGCEDLALAITRVKPKLHIFGHIHEGYGETTDGTTRYLNVSTCTSRYRPTNPPVVIDL